MALKADTRYPAKVISAALTESSKGTTGIVIDFETPDGHIEHTIWLTEKTAPRAADDLVRLGADREKLRSWAYLENIGTAITGGECDITTVEEEYKGKARVRVQWMNDKRKPASGKASARAAQLFGGPSVDGPKNQAPQGGVDDEEVPF